MLNFLKFSSPEPASCHSLQELKHQGSSPVLDLTALDLEKFQVGQKPVVSPLNETVALETVNKELPLTEQSMGSTQWISLETVWSSEHPSLDLLPRRPPRKCHNVWSLIQHSYHTEGNEGEDCHDCKHDGGDKHHHSCTHAGPKEGYCCDPATAGRSKRALVKQQHCCSHAYPVAMVFSHWLCILQVANLILK